MYTEWTVNTDMLILLIFSMVGALLLWGAVRSERKSKARLDHYGIMDDNYQELIDELGGSDMSYHNPDGNYFIRQSTREEMVATMNIRENMSGPFIKGDVDYADFNLFLATHVVDVKHSQSTWGVCEVCGEDFDQDEGTCYFSAKRSIHGYDKPLVIVCNSCDPNKESDMEENNYGHASFCPLIPTCICNVGEKEDAKMEKLYSDYPVEYHRVVATTIAEVITDEMREELQQKVRAHLRELSKTYRIGYLNDVKFVFEEYDIETVELSVDYDAAGDDFDKMWVEYSLQVDILPR